MRNWDNSEHIAELAELWNVDPALIPHWAPPTHAMQIWRYAEQGSIELLWISATNPAVTLPDLARIRRILEQERLMVVVQDIFLTETAALADVVLPGATWGEKTGTFTNADRTVHLSEQAVEPPGEARADLDIFLDYARRMDFRDQEGGPLVPWNDPESAFEAWKACSRGRPCDYSELTYERLRREGGIQWGGERLYTDGTFNTDPDYSETFGHHMQTGASETEEQYRAKQPNGRAFLHAVPHQPPPETPGEGHPLLLTTGRTVYHFHTRTKTGRAPELDAAAPGRARGACTARRHPARHRLRAVPLRRLAQRARGAPGGERADRHGLGPREGGLGLLRDLHDLYLMASECDMAWTLVGQAAQGARDTDLLAVVQACEGETAAQLQWLKSRMKEAAPQALVVAG
jgi:anaerobic selenocysteine-containing dehydrogenase